METPKGMVLDNGDLIFPIKGLPPKEVEGYFRDEYNPYVFHPVFPECEHHAYEDHPKPCCKHYHINVCRDPVKLESAQAKQDGFKYVSYAQCCDCSGKKNESIQNLEKAQEGFTLRTDPELDPKIDPEVETFLSELEDNNG